LYSLEAEKNSYGGKFSLFIFKLLLSDNFQIIILKFTKKQTDFKKKWKTSTKVRVSSSRMNHLTFEKIS